MSVARTDEPGAVSELISERLYRILTERIIDGALEPGQRIDPGAIAAEFRVSRAPVRDALTRMEFEQMVETRPRHGSFVVRPTEQDIHEVCQLRKAIEWVATGLATAEISPDALRRLRDEAVSALEAADRGVYEPFFESDRHLHDEIISATGNTRLCRARAAVAPWIAWLRVLGATGVNRIAGSTARHLQIIDAMLAGDADAAQAAAALHLDEVEAWAIEDFPGTARPDRTTAARLN